MGGYEIIINEVGVLTDSSHYSEVAVSTYQCFNMGLFPHFMSTSNLLTG